MRVIWNENIKFIKLILYEHNVRSNEFNLIRIYKNVVKINTYVFSLKDTYLRLY